MTIIEWLQTTSGLIAAENIKVNFEQPSIDDPLPLVLFGTHTDLDASSKIGTLNTVEQQIDLFDEITTPPIEFERTIAKIKNVLSRVVRWDNITVTTSIDTSAGRQIRRAMFLVTITI